MSQRIEEGQRVEVCEGSWAERRGEVVALLDDEHVRVRFDDGATECVVACTLALEVLE